MKMRLLYAVPVFLLLFLNSCTSDSPEETPVLEAENVITIEQDLLDIVSGNGSGKCSQRLSIGNRGFSRLVH